MFFSLVSLLVDYSIYNKHLLDEVFVISRIIKVEVFYYALYEKKWSRQ